MAAVGAVGEGVALSPPISTLGAASLARRLGGVLCLCGLGQQVGSEGAGQGGLAGALLTGAQLQTPHVTHHCSGVKRLPPLALGKVLLDLGTDRLMDVLI